MAAIQITEYTDPGCPFAYSAEPLRWRLRWRYGAQLEWRLRMVVLAETDGDYAAKGLTAEILASGNERLAREHGMPMDTRVKPRLWATAPACRAVVAARAHAPELEWLLLRRLRVRHFEGALLDEPSTIADAAVDVGIDPVALAEWMEGTSLADDMAAARNPSAAALAQPHKLAAWDGGMRYTCPSYEFGLSVPGFQPWAAYEVAFANVAPQLERREPPAAVTELLRWAGTPLASAEVAAVMEISLPEAREALGRVAVEHHVGADGFWSITD